MKSLQRHCLDLGQR